MSLNRVTLLGNVGRDPEVKSFVNGGRIASFSIATSEKWKDKNTGEAKERTDWHNVSIQADGLVGVVEKYVRKGTKLYVEGQLQTRKWQDQAGNDRYTTEVVIRPYSGKLELLGDPKGGDDRGQSSYGQSSSSYGAGGGTFDDSIPFLPEKR